MITVKFFAQFRELLGTESLELAIGDGTTIADLRTLLASEISEFDSVVRPNEFLCALNHTLTDQHAVLSDGDEVAFLPPVTGG
ncbi:molybdopterin converting factor subunit 1 [Alteromonas sp. ASW11-36]|uniref:Molybdopterin synthase sulfur carrier subunit n=1 Tax=Alteromonas arenosi TaxID=3055817 RepID=A0ABT7SWG1_9ALTE|nr:molybdopterin converting factor subunit 1 [Alteromonas sp. ASW11-36]MDM7860490.1 molybdopterin converting factor subunit 1 [Alteromonas sp. ASW11-36]